MSDDRNQQQTGRARPNGMEPIKVKEIRFCVKDGRDIKIEGYPVDGGVSIIETGSKRGIPVEIEYKPWLRHHHVRTFTGEGDKRKLLGEVMIPESWVSWTPYPGEAP